MKISIFGSSSIAHHHILAAKKNNFKIHSICTSNKKSKNIKLVSKKFNIKNIYYDWISFLKDCRLNNCSVVICGRISDNEKILKKCLEYNLSVLIEKPIFSSCKKFDKFMNNKKNIFVGYNRIYYSSISKIKKIILKEKLINISIKCPEKNIKSIIFNSCHIISILNHLFEEIKLVKKIKNKNFIFCIFKTKLKVPIFLNFTFNAIENFSIEFNFKKKKIILSPIEKMILYNKVYKKKYRKTNIYIPNIKKIIDEYKIDSIKPGFTAQYRNFKNFLKNRKNIKIDISAAKKIISLCNDIVN